MTEAAVDNVGLEYPGLEAGEACLDFGNHSAVNHAFGNQLAAFLGSQSPDQARGFITCCGEFSRRIGEEDELLGLECPGHGRGGACRH